VKSLLTVIGHECVQGAAVVWFWDVQRAVINTETKLRAKQKVAIFKNKCKTMEISRWISLYTDRILVYVTVIGISAESPSKKRLVANRPLCSYLCTPVFSGSIKITI
jgi:hypothetical protein